MLTAYKLLRVRKDGTLGPLFINKRQVIPPGEWLEAEDHTTPGFKSRPGWHATHAPVAPHLSTKGRAWFLVELEDTTEHHRPERQGGLWYTAKRMRVVREAWANLEEPSDV